MMHKARTDRSGVCVCVCVCVGKLYLFKKIIKRRTKNGEISCTYVYIANTGKDCDLL